MNAVTETLVLAATCLVVSFVWGMVGCWIIGTSDDRWWGGVALESLHSARTRAQYESRLLRMAMFWPIAFVWFTIVWFRRRGKPQVIPESGGHLNSYDCWCIPRTVRLCPACDGQDGGCPECEFDEKGCVDVSRDEYLNPKRGYNVLTIHNSFGD